MKKLNKISLFVAFLCFLNYSNAQKFGAEKLDSLLSRTLDSMQKVHKGKSLSAAIQFKNGTNWTRAKGVSSENPLIFAATDQTYLIGSVTKTITSACILQLADEKKLNLDDSLFRWVDTFKFINPNVTIRQLLRHQSGIYDVLQHPQNQAALLAKKDSIWSYKNFIKKFIKPSVFEAGTDIDYCNTGYFLLGMIIEKASGQPYYKEIRKRFFTPLGLNSFKLAAYEGLPSNISHVWIDLNGDGILDDAHTFYTTWKSLNAVAGSAGGYYALPSDVAKWMRSYMRGDLLSPAMMAQAKQTIYAPKINGVNYGLGLMERTIGGLKAYGHGGDLSYSATSFYFPTKDISITVHCNDSKYPSYTLDATVAALLKTYTKYENLLTVDDKTLEKINFELKIMPNPFSENARISLKLPKGASDLKLVFTNLLGENVGVISKQNLSEGLQVIDTQELAFQKGIYVVSVFADGKMVAAERMVKL